jgi:hypothetical protein
MSYEADTIANDDVVGNDFDTDLGDEVEANNRSVHKHTTGVSLPVTLCHLPTKA